MRSEHVFVSERLERVAEIRRKIDALEGDWLALVAEYDRSGEWYESGFLTTAASRRHACRMNASQASAHVSLARKLATLPEVLEPGRTSDNSPFRAGARNDEPSGSARRG